MLEFCLDKYQNEDDPFSTSSSQKGEIQKLHQELQLYFEISQVTNQSSSPSPSPRSPSSLPSSSYPEASRLSSHFSSSSFDWITLQEKCKKDARSVVINLIQTKHYDLALKVLFFFFPIPYSSFLLFFN